MLILISGRIQLRNYSGHISLIFDVVNSHTKGLYEKLDDASACVHTAIRRIHEEKNKATRSQKKAAENNINGTDAV